MSHAGKFVWYELMTPDAAASRAFYRSVVGWGVQAMPMPGFEYTMMTAGEIPVAGLMEMNDDTRKAGARLGWTGYVGVDDVDAMTAKAKGLGATVCMPPMDIPNDVGRFSLIQDPVGASIALFKGAGEMPDGGPVERGMPGRVGWNELYAADGATGAEFYAALFGWRQVDQMDMGPMGAYRIFDAAGHGVGMMTKPPMAPAPAWTYYFNVDSAVAAVARVTSAGGTVTLEPIEVPGGGWASQGIDPQGIPFALFSMKK